MSHDNIPGTLGPIHAEKDLALVYRIADEAAQVTSRALSGSRAVASTLRPGSGQGLAEYALILALIAIVAIIALIFLGGQVSKILSTVGKSV